MHPTFPVPPLGLLAVLANKFVYPLMVLIAPTGESPQLTHFWNNIRIERAEVEHLEAYAMVECEGDPRAKRRRGRWDIRFHINAWPQYLVIEPVDWKDNWYIGWIGAIAAGVSQVPIKGQVRMLIGPEHVAFFGVREGDYEQIDLRKVGRGVLGGGGKFRRVPLH